MLDSIVIEYLLHFTERARFENVFQIGMPDSKPFKTCSGGGFYAFTKIKRAVLPVRMRDSAGNRPIRRQQFDILLHVASQAATASWAITDRTASTIFSSFGMTWFSSGSLYGMGVSRAVTTLTGARRDPNACSAISPAI